jgi:hypothetical protein
MPTFSEFLNVVVHTAVHSMDKIGCNVLIALNRMPDSQS